jgi:hypothetical protein
VGILHFATADAKLVDECSTMAKSWMGVLQVKANQEG